MSKNFLDQEEKALEVRSQQKIKANYLLKVLKQLW